MNFISVLFSLVIYLCSEVQISKPYKSGEIGKNYTLSNQNVFELNYVSKRRSEFPKICNNLLTFAAMSFFFPYEILHLKYVTVLKFYLWLETVL
jgi:hypothetical protein